MNTAGRPLAEMTDTALVDLLLEQTPESVHPLIRELLRRLHARQLQLAIPRDTGPLKERAV